VELELEPTLRRLRHPYGNAQQRKAACSERAGHELTVQLDTQYSAVLCNIRVGNREDDEDQGMSLSGGKGAGHVDE
jgi:hypothetical protein